jgi:hypothetical protein
MRGLKERGKADAAGGKRERTDQKPDDRSGIINYEYYSSDELIWVEYLLPVYVI